MSSREAVGRLRVGSVVVAQPPQESGRQESEAATRDHDGIGRTMNGLIG